MNKIGMLLGQLHDSEVRLASEYRAVADRQAAEHDVFYLGHTVATQCDQRAETVRAIAKRFGKDLSPPSGSQALHNLTAGIQRKTSELIGRRPEPGLLLLRDLRHLYLLAEEANIGWIALGQVAQALPDQNLLDQVSVLHKQALTQIKWLKTRIKQACPQILLVAS